MITQSGVHITPDNDERPTPEDIAVAMTRITRYAGAVWCPLAAHSILVAELCIRTSGFLYDWAWGLLHDAHEIITGDVTKPFGNETFRAMKKGLDGRIAAVFHLDFPDDNTIALVKMCDQQALVVEATQLGLPGFMKIHGAAYNEAGPSDDHLSIWRHIVVNGGWLTRAPAPKETLTRALRHMAHWPGFRGIDNARREITFKEYAKWESTVKSYP